MKIEKIEIKGLFGKKDICWKLNPQVNVLVGENGSGKSTILAIIQAVLSNNLEFYNDFLVFRCQGAKLFFNAGHKFIGTSKPIDDVELEQLESTIPSYIFNTIKNSIRIPTSYISISGQVLNNPADKNNNLLLDIIKTNITNSNANHIIQKSNQQMDNVLDMEIRDTIYTFNQITNPELINRLSGSLNFFFNPIGKQVTYENNEWVYTDTQLQKTLNYSDLSSGERQLIYILLRVALSNGDKSKTAIMLMDEPEISLHLNWQEHFIKQLTLLNPDAQFIIVTHSPALIMNGWNDVYVDMAEITRDMEQAQS